ncbi:MAG: DUF3796 domain-containing protein [Candidatus Bathyarchaeia archaeon]|jgi:hypothetical protein
MRKNKLGYIGILGLIGLLGITGNNGLFGFFGFFGFFAMLKGKGNDERINRNIDHSCKNAFAYDTIIASALIAYVGLSKTFDPTPISLFIAALALGTGVFGLSYYYYDTKGE